MNYLVENNNHFKLNNDNEVKKNTKEKKVYDKETIREYNKLFFQRNKDKKYYCDLCNCQVSFFNAAHHKASKKHMTLLEKNQYMKKIEEKDMYIKKLEEKEYYSKLLDQKEQYERLLKENEEQIIEFKKKLSQSN
jgi:hypothetical protein